MSEPLEPPKYKKRPLTMKEKKYVKEYVRTGVKKAAVRVAYPNAAESSLEPMAVALSNRPVIKEAINDTLDRMYPNHQEIFMHKLIELASAPTRMSDWEVGINPSEQIKLIELYLKFKGAMAPERKEVKSLSLQLPFNDAYNSQKIENTSSPVPPTPLETTPQVDGSLPPGLSLPQVDNTPVREAELTPRKEPTEE